MRFHDLHADSGRKHFFHQLPSASIDATARVSTSRNAARGRPVEEVSVGDIVLSGGEPAALMLLDACIRLLPGVMGAPSSGTEESFEEGLLEYPHYTRPAEWEGRTIPEVLRSGDHAKIEAWRKQPSSKTIHGYAGQTFGSATVVLGTDLPLARGDE